MKHIPVTEVLMHVVLITFVSDTWDNISGSGYYHISNVMHDTNTVQEKPTSVMCDSNTCSCVAPLFRMALRIS